MKTFAQATVTKKEDMFEIDITLMNKNFEEIQKINGMVETLDVCLATSILETIRVLDMNDTLIFISDSKDMKRLLILDQQIGMWKQVYEVCLSKKISIGYISKDRVSFGGPVTYKDLIPMQMEKDLEQGRLVNGGEMIIDMGREMPKKESDVQILRIISVSFDVNCRQILTRVGVADTRIIRVFTKVNDPEIRPLTISLSNGKEIRLQQWARLLALETEDGKKNPLIILDGDAMPPKWVKKGDPAWAKYYATRDAICKGIIVGGVRYVYLSVSASGQRQIKMLFVRADISLPQGIVNMLPENYVQDVLSKLSDVEKIIEFTSYGAYGLMKGKMGVSNKAMTRLGMGQSSTMGCKSFPTRIIGRVIVPWSKMIEDMYRRAYEACGWTEARILRNLNKLEQHWKEDAVDGVNLITTEALVEALNDQGIACPTGKKWDNESALAYGSQARCAMVKGMFFAVDRELLWNFSYVNNSGETVFPYNGFDIIVEENSLKEKWNAEVYSGDLAPGFEIVGMSKIEGSHTCDSQLVSCMQYEEESSKEILKAILNRGAEAVIASVSDIRNARISSGIIGKPNPKNPDFSMFGKRRSIKEGILQYIDQQDGPVEEPYTVKSILEDCYGRRDETMRGKVKIEGERRHMVPDISAFWLGRVVEREDKCFISGMPLFDIIVDSPEHCSIPEAMDVYTGNVGPLAVYKNPLNMQGEIVFANGISYEELTDEWARYIYSNMKGVIVFSLFSASANLMAGSDFDGDIAMVMWDKEVLKLLKQEDVIFIDVDNKAPKIVISYENLRDALSNNLVDPGIGIITNYGATWSEMASIIKYLGLTDTKVVEIPSITRKNFSDDPEAKPYFQESWYNVFLEKKKTTYGWKKGLCYMAEDALVAHAGSMEPWEVECIDAMKALIKPDFMEIMKKTKITRNEFDIIKQPLLDCLTAAITVVRYLQELAINTAKSDIWAFYKRVNIGMNAGQLVSSDRYEYVSTWIRPLWKRGIEGEIKNTFQADYTPMGMVFSYTQKLYENTFSTLMAQTKPMESLSSAKKDSPLYLEIDSLVKRYNLRRKAEIDKLKKSDAESEEFSKVIGIVNTEFYQEIERLEMNNNPVDVLRCAYTATYENSNKKYNKGFNFVYGVMADELMCYLNNSSTEAQIVPIRVRLTDKAVLSSGTYEAEYDELTKKTFVLRDGAIIGMTSAISENGKIDIYVVEDCAFAYISVDRPIKTVQSKEFGRKIGITGFKAYGFSERKLIEGIRAKVGMKYERLAYDLGENQDILRFEEGTMVDSNGVQRNVILAKVGGTVIGGVASEYVTYVRSIMKYGDVMVIEWVNKNSAFSMMSSHIRIIDVVAR